jgi:hypothetical protein
MPTPSQTPSPRSGPSSAPHAATTIHAGPGAATPYAHSFSEIATTRDLFWQNIVREMLTSLAVQADSRRYQIIAELETRRGQVRLGGATITTSPELTPSPPGPPSGSAGAEGADEEGDGLPPGAHPDMPLDGRVAILTKAGERIPIADVRPLLACSVPGTEAERALSIDVQCTIFQIVAPSGEVFTLPLHEIRAIHAISEELMDRLKETSRRQDAAAGRPGDADDSKPFGFAAFTSLANKQSRTTR